MESVIKTYLGIFLTFIGVFVAVGVISACIAASNAVSFHADVIKEVEDSNFAPRVIEACKTSAESAGYGLEILEIKDATGRTVMAEVILDYDYNIPFLKVFTQHEKRGFAR